MQESWWHQLTERSHAYERLWFRLSEVANRRNNYRSQDKDDFFMISRTVLKLAFDKRFLPLFIGLIVVSILIVYAPPIHAQSSTPEWQAAAGGKMEFDVASVRQNSPESPYRAMLTSMPRIIFVTQVVS